MDNKTQASTASWINVLLGIWLIIAPFLLGYNNTNPFWNDIIVGTLVVVFALIRGLTPSRNTFLSWSNVALGIWLIAAPFLLSYMNPTPLWNDIILGILIGGLALWSSSATTNPRIAGT